NFSEQTAFGADILGSTKKNSYIAKASLGTSFSIFQVTAGYGVTLGSAKVITWVPEGFSFGANAWLGSKVRLMIFYNQIEAFYLGATVIF
ncbi:MAG: hypothetical protein HY074_01780, partial [Deltaproteobacteria bacterium]|nr:hypothetical protein [Deltaproteobacteria bacterium]